MFVTEQKLLEWWLPPDGSGEPVACLATSFTFDTDFFRDECLGRFIGLRGAVGEEGVGSLAQINELEERLSNVSACALVDRSASIEGRNLRWDVIPVAAPGGLLHAKTSLLIWENLIRVIIGSANLTPAGYRYQREIAVAFDLSPATGVPESFWQEYLESLQRILDLVPADLSGMGPRTRAETSLELLSERIEQYQPPTRQSRDRIRVVLTRPGNSAITELNSFMSGLRPRNLRAMSPFWDSEDQGESDAVRGLTGLLASKGAARAEFLAPLEANVGGALVHAPRDLTARAARKTIAVELLGVTDGSEFSTDDRRRLHAKALVLESDDTTTVMVGSSNMTSAGLGLNSHSGHYELNVLYSVETGSRAAKELGSLLYHAVPITEESKFVDSTDPDEKPLQPSLPLGFVSALLMRSEDTWSVLLQLNPEQLPSAWTVTSPGTGQELLSSGEELTDPLIAIALISAKDLPQMLSVRWTNPEGEVCNADWVINAANPADLPLDERLRAIPVDLIVQALAQRGTNPTAALERLLDSLSNDSQDYSYELASPLDPLKAFDDSRALLRRVGTYGRALDELEAHLSRPTPTISALGWRLKGLVSPTRLAEGWVDQCINGDLPPEVAHFLLAEIMLVINRVDWVTATQLLDQKQVDAELIEVKRRWTEAMDRLPTLHPDHGLNEYVRAAVRYDHG